jgi:hypothetical protein
MDRRETKPSSDQATQKFGAGSLALIGCCVGVAIIGIFIGVIIVYGGMQAQ